jgi:hypothetical protein
MFDPFEMGIEFFEGLRAIDEAIVERAAQEPCRDCGGPLYRGDHPRKPRGGLLALAAEAFDRRFSLCCASTSAPSWSWRARSRSRQWRRAPSSGRRAYRLAPHADGCAGGEVRSRPARRSWSCRRALCRRPSVDGSPSRYSIVSSEIRPLPWRSCWRGWLPSPRRAARTDRAG